MQDDAELIERINNALAGDGQQLVGTDIVQTHDGPLMFPCEPYVVEHNVDVEVLARTLGVSKKE